jgi:hypothetical protein
MKCFVVLLAFCFSLQSTAAVLNGNEGAEGGDEVGMEFQLIARKALRDIKNNYPEIGYRFSPEAYMFYVFNTTTLVVDEDLNLIVKGARQDSVAVNIASEKIIYLNRARWNQISDQRVKYGIVLHEYLSLMGLESTGMYNISAQYMSLLGAPKTAAFPVKNSLGFTSFQCDNQNGFYQAVLSSQSELEATLTVAPGKYEERLQKFARMSGVESEGVVGISFRQMIGAQPSGAVNNLHQSNTCQLLKSGHPDLACVNYSKQQTVTFLYKDKHQVMARIDSRDLSVGPMLDGKVSVNLSLMNDWEMFKIAIGFSVQECSSGEAN